MQSHLRLTMIAGVLLLATSCARRPLPLAEAPQLAGTPAALAPDLEAVSRELTGDQALDLARLRLVEGREGEPLALDGGWLLTLRRETVKQTGVNAGSQALLVWLGTGRAAGQARALARADSLRLLDLKPGDDARLLLWERDEQDGMTRRRLVERGLDGRERVLVQGPVDRLRWEEAPAALRLAEEEEAPAFRESPGAWHLERRMLVLQEGGGWRLGPADPVDSPYRALSEFLGAARRGHWGAARARAELSRLLALPGGGWSRRLKASLRKGSPELLDRSLRLSAPRQGPITRLEAPSGSPAWRVELERLPDSRGRVRWVLTRLERVVSGE